MKSSRTDRNVLTAAILGVFFTNGMSILLVSPSIVHLERLLESSVSALSAVFIARNLGYLAGAFVGGLTFDKLGHAKMQFALLVGVFFAMTSVSPWCYSVFDFTIAWTVFGMAAGYFETGANPFSLKLWSGHRLERPVMQATYLCWSLGAAISPIITRNFLVSLSPGGHYHIVASNASNNDTSLTANALIDFNSTFAMNLTQTLTDIANEKNAIDSQSSNSSNLFDELNRNITQIATNSDKYGDIISRDYLSNNSNTYDANYFPSSCLTVYSQAEVGQVRFAFLTVASPYLCLMALFAWLIMRDRSDFIDENCELPDKCHSETSDLTYKQEHHHHLCTTRVGKIFFLLTVLYYFSHCLCESILSIVLTPIAVKVWGFAEKDAALLFTVLLFGCLSGRLLTIPLSTWLLPSSIISIHLVLLLLGITLLFLQPLFSATHVFLFVSLATFGFGISTLHTTGLLFVNRYSTLTSVLTSRILISGAVGWMVGPSCGSLLLHHLGHVAVFFSMLVAALVTSGAFVALVIISTCASQSIKSFSDCDRKLSAGNDQLIPDADVIEI